ncbi:MFS transporter [Salmonella enterica subsp. enterica]|nr:MFS transporter [Salmonella enterica subsp. enterica]
MRDQVNISIWKDISFRMLFMGSFFCALAGKIYELTMPLLIFDITHSSEIMGWIRAIEYLPYLLLAVIMGVWIDRVDRKRWSQWMIAGQIVCLIGGWWAVQFLTQPMWVLFPCAFLMMAGNFGYLNARMGMVKHILPAFQQGQATSALGTLNSLFQTLGPLVSGILLLFSHFDIVLLLIALPLFISWLLLDKVPDQSVAPAAYISLVDDIRKGWRILRDNTILLQMSLAISVFNMCSMVFVIQSMYVARAIFSFDAFHIGLMVSAGGIGGLLGASVVNILRHKLGMGYAFAMSIIVQSLCYLFILLNKNGMAMGLAFFWNGFFETSIGILVYTWRQESVAVDNLGKVMGITGTLFKLAAPFGLALSGYVMVLLNINWLFFSCFLLQIMVGCILLFNPLMRTCR